MGNRQAKTVEKTEPFFEKTGRFPLCESILDAVTDGLSIHDLDYKVVQVNQALADMFGVTKQDLIGRKCYEIFHGLAGPIVECPHTKSVDTKQPAFLRLEEPYLGGKVFHVSTTPLFDSEGNVTSTVHIVREATEQENLARVKDQAMDELGRANSELEQVSYAATHDLQEPLRTVTSYVQMIQSRYGDRLDANVRDFLGYAASGALHMQEMIDDLLAYSRIGMEEKSFVATDFGQALSEAQGNLEEAIKESGAEITSDPLPVISSDSSQIALLFENLVENAVKFRQEGTAPRIHVSAEKKGDKWVFAVKDNGLGIDPKFFDSIFGIFQQLHPPERYPGTGIGLAICKRILERHGGAIWVESEPGKGSTFFFSIPEARYETDLDMFGRQRLRW